MNIALRALLFLSALVLNVAPAHAQDADDLETQIGTMLSPRVGLYGEYFLRTGGKEPYDWAGGVAVRVMF